MIEGEGERAQHTDASDEENVEGKPFPTLINSRGEQRVVRSAEEAIALVKEWDTSFGVVGGKSDESSNRLLEVIGISWTDLYEILYQYREDKLLALNKDKELLYLKGGNEKWLENVRSYHYFERLDHEQFKRLKAEEKLASYSPRYPEVEGLEAEVLKQIEAEIGHIAHFIGKDTDAILYQYARFNRELVAQQIQFEPFDTKNLKEVFDVVDYYFNYSGGASEKLEQVKQNLKPKEVTPYKQNPLLSPFEEACKKLQSEGVEHIPAWLAEQAKMAGTSAVYSDVQNFISQFVKDATRYKEQYDAFILQNGITGAPLFYFPKNKFILNNEKLMQYVNRPSKPKEESTEG